MKKKLQNSKTLYWGLIITFTLIYVFIGFVSTLHSIEFFKLANQLWLAIMLGVAYETGQISVLFSILMTKNKNTFLPWLLMLLMTSLQITANVYASYKYMVANAGTDWQLWKQSILFWLDASDPEMYRVVISWITGALLPVVSLGLTALVAQNIQLKDEEVEDEVNIEPPKNNIQHYTKLSKEIEDEYPEELLKLPDKVIEEPEKIETPKKVKELLKGAKKVPAKKKKALKNKQSIKEAKKVLAELKKPSKGEELIEKINSGEIVIPEPKLPIIESDINQPIEEKDKIPINNESIKQDGVEVIDVKAIPKDKSKVDKYGIPINPDERLTWDKL